MFIPKRNFFFILDYLVLSLIIVADVHFWSLPEPMVIWAFIVMSLAVYGSSFFLFNAFYVRIEQSNRLLRDNLLALIKGVWGGVLGVLVLIFFFFQPYRNILVYRALYNADAIIMTLLLLRLLEFKFFRAKELFRALILGSEPYLHLYIQDILKHIAAQDSEIFIATPVSSSIRKDNNAVAVGHCTVRYINGTEAKALINNGSPFNTIVLGREPLDQELLDLVPICYQAGLSVIGIDGFYEQVCRKIPLFPIGESWLADTSFKRPHPGSMFLKRTFDIVCSFLLLILFFPLGTLVALAIKLDSKGPVFFIQERTGRKGKTFKIYKFRSMKVHADDSLKWPHWEADLVTRVGYFIRRTGLDEVPQLLNILKGDMSFVGPRPARPLVTQRHIAKIPFYGIWLALRPGVTGWAQLHQGQDMGDITVLDKIRYNLYYAKHLSFWFELEIFFKTVRIALSRQKPQPTYEIQDNFTAESLKIIKEE